MKDPAKIAPKHVKELYPGVCQWLEIFLKDRFRQAEIDVHTLPHIQISHFLRTYNKGNFPTEWVTWHIKVDVVGFVHHSNKPTTMAFVECKNTTLTLAHLSQLLGYSRIAQPFYSFLISPVGFSPTLVSLLQEYQRRDVLEYQWEAGRIPRKVVVAQWDTTTANLNRHTMIGGIGI